MIGQTLSHYKIINKIGQGGMGEVYLAQDTTLDRKVALKFLSEELQQDSTARKRFLREARSAAALDHPYICKIYEIGEAEEKSFISMEYIQGTTLQEELLKGPLSLKEALEKATEIAEALEAAHQQKIVHRDLKPSNIMLTLDGHVKVMDFGLAKRVTPAEGGQEEEITTALTREGALLGTVPYMSVEQVRGQVVDTRSDIFSFGVVLYEMLTGVNPFKKDGQIETAHAIVSETPPPLSQYTNDIPVVLQHIVKRMLAKDPTRRIQSAMDIRNELEELRGDLSAGLVQEAVLRGPRSAVQKRVAVVAIILVLALAGLLLYLVQTPQDTVPRLVNPVQVTFAVGVENFPTWSPDGGRLAYESNQDGNWDIWVTQLGAGEPVNRTVDHSGPDRYPSWSPDGRQIAFLSQRDETWGLYTMAAVGGMPRKVVSLAVDPVYYGGTPQWSADGAQIAVAVWDPPSSYAEVVSWQTQETRRIPFPQHEGNPCLDLSWSADGRLFAYVEADGDAAEVSRLWTMPVSGGQAIPVTDGRTNDRSPIWSADGRQLFFVSNRGGPMDLWRQRMSEDGRPEGEPKPVTTGLAIRSAVFSSDGAKVAYSQGRPVANLWRLPILADRPANWADAQQITFDNALVQFFDLSPDGQRLALSSDRAGNQDLWILPSGGGQISQLTSDPTPDWAPRWSPDGEEIAFYAYRSGSRDVWVMPSGGGPARQLAPHPAEDTVPTWSPDGLEIAFTSRRGGNRDIWIVGAEGGEARQVTVQPADDSITDWSGDGRWLVFQSESRLFRISPAGGQPEPLIEPVGLFGARLSSDGKVLYYLGEDNLRALSLEEGGQYPMTDLAGRRGTLGWGVATDGQFLYFSWAEETGDIWVMDVSEESRN
jgi:Tol biopolymer transport system component/tRNA A-37 threonylcarbamoyl transferase component Bud32